MPRIYENVRSASALDLRPYQLQSINSVLRKWSEFDRLLGVAPTGSGKTIKFAHIANARAQTGRVLIMAHRDELIDQARGKLFKACELLSSKEKASDYADPDAGVVVASVQTLARNSRLQRFARDHFQTVIVDEAHHTLADSYLRILNHFGQAKVLGVTATPDRGDKRDLARFYEDIAFEISLLDLIKDHWLCPIRIKTVPLKIDISAVGMRAGDYSEEELAQSIEPMLHELADAICVNVADRKTLIFTPLVRTADQFADILRQRGLAAESVCGESPDRKGILSRFASGETGVLCNAMLLTEGYDEPSIDCVIPLRPTTIRSLYSQQIGRGTRIHPGKENLLLLDFLWLSRTHDLVGPASLIATCAITPQAMSPLWYRQERSDFAQLECGGSGKGRETKLADSSRRRYSSATPLCTRRRDLYKELVTAPITLRCRINAVDQSILDSGPSSFRDGTS
jgi:superfamily II DNA or RNA helicase